MRQSRGQSLTEYALILAVVLAALTGMQTYLKRSLQAKLRAHSDHLLGYAGAEETQRRGLLNPNTTRFDFTTDVPTAETTVQRTAVGGVVTQQVESHDRVESSGTQQFTQLEGAPVPGGRRR